MAHFVLSVKFPIAELHRIIAIAVSFDEFVVAFRVYRAVFDAPVQKGTVIFYLPTSRAFYAAIALLW